MQRLRDQIRTWALLPDMRDPEPLHTARRDIEFDMVRPGCHTMGPLDLSDTLVI